MSPESPAPREPGIQMTGALQRLSRVIVRNPVLCISEKFWCRSAAHPHRPLIIAILWRSSKKNNFSEEKLCCFPYFFSEHRLWVLIRTSFFLYGIKHLFEPLLCSKRRLCLLIVTASISTLRRFNEKPQINMSRTKCGLMRSHKLICQEQNDKI